MWSQQRGVQDHNPAAECQSQNGRLLPGGGNAKISLPKPPNYPSGQAICYKFHSVGCTSNTCGRDHGHCPKLLAGGKFCFGPHKLQDCPNYCKTPPGTSSDEVLGAAGKESTESARAECGEGKLTGGGSTHCGFERSTRDGPRAKPAGQSRHARGRMIANNPRNVHSRGSSERGEGRSQSRTSSYFSQ